VKSIAKKTNKKAAFTIIELLTVMSVIVILISLLIPALNRVRRYAKLVTQKNQFHSISVAMGLFNAEEDCYPDSGKEDEDGEPYCGAMKLCEAMMGQDLLGFHPDSRDYIIGILFFRSSRHNSLIRIDINSQAFSVGTLNYKWNAVIPVFQYM